ncbi:MAG: hypothetical protein JXA52_02625 [Planctomycetes bacterium]|nr:hypothetical protein [Planctomycetota bacterium]
MAIGRQHHFNVLTLFVSLILAVVVWAYVDDRRIEVNWRKVPLIINAPEGWELEKGYPTEFLARLQTPRGQAENLSNKDLAVVKNITVPTSDTEGDINQVQVELRIQNSDLSLPPGVKVVEILEPEGPVSINRLVPQYIEVKPVVTGEPNPGYRILREAEPSQRTVKVMAPKGSIPADAYLECYPINIEGATRDVVRYVGVKPKRIGERLIRSNIDIWVSVSIEPIPEARKFEKMPVRVLFGPAQIGLRAVQITPSTVSLTIEGPEVEVLKISERDSIVYVDMSEITEQVKGEHTLKCYTKLPPEVALKAINPGEVSVIIR